MAEEKKEVVVVKTLGVAPVIYDMIMGEAPLDLAVIESDEFAEFLTVLTTYKDNIAAFFDAFQSKMKEVLRKQYLETGNATVSSVGFKHTYVPGTTRTSFDSKALKEADPDTYNKYVKISPVAESIKTTAIKKKEEKVED